MRRTRREERVVVLSKVVLGRCRCRVSLLDFTCCTLQADGASILSHSTSIQLPLAPLKHRLRAHDCPRVGLERNPQATAGPTALHRTGSDSKVQPSSAFLPLHMTTSMHTMSDRTNHPRPSLPICPISLQSAYKRTWHGGIASTCYKSDACRQS